MTINELLKAIDSLTADELRQLRERLDQRQYDIATQSPDALDRALDRLSEGLDDEQLDRIEWAMNYEIVQPPDKSSWRD